MRAYVIIPIPLIVNGTFVIFDEFYLRCPQTGNCFLSKTETTFVSDYIIDSGGEMCSNGKLLQFQTFDKANEYVETELLK